MDADVILTVSFHVLLASLCHLVTILLAQTTQCLCKTILSFQYVTM